MCVCRGTWAFSSRNTSSLASGGGVLVSAMARTSQHEQNPRTRQKKKHDERFCAPLVCMAPPMLALPDNILFPTSAGIEMVIQAYFDQVLSCAASLNPSRPPLSLSVALPLHLGETK
jgi:hypothetical protein